MNRRPVNIVNGIDLRKHGGLIGRVVKRYRAFIGGALEWEDLFQAGWIGLHRAAEGFEPERGHAFSTYATWWIRQNIRRCVMDQRRTVRIPVHAQTSAHQRGELLALDAYSLDVPLDGSNPRSDTWLDTLRAESGQEDALGRRELEEHVEAALAALDEKDRRVIRGRFWREHTLEEVGDDMTVSRERIRQRQDKAICQLERPLRHLREAL